MSQIRLSSLCGTEEWDPEGVVGTKVGKKKNPPGNGGKQRRDGMHIGYVGSPNPWPPQPTVTGVPRSTPSLTPIMRLWSQL